MARIPEAVPPPAALPVEIELVLVRFRLLARRRAAWLQSLWSEEGDPGRREPVTHAEAAAILEDRDSPGAELEWAGGAAWREPINRIERSLAGDSAGRLAQLSQIFGLGAEERDLLEACLATSVDPSLSRLCAYLQDHTGRAYMTEELAARLYRHGRRGPWNAESALYRWQLIEFRDAGVAEPRALECDPFIRDWLLGRDTLDSPLIGAAALHPAPQPLPSWPVARNTQFLQDTLGGDPPGRVRITVIGARGSGRRSFAAVLSSNLRLPLLVVDTDQVEDHNWRRVFLLAQRHAFLERCALAWIGERLSRRPWPRTAALFPLQFVIAETEQETPPVAELIDRVVAMPAPALAEREALWNEYLPASRHWPRKEFMALAHSYRVQVGDIADASRLRVSSAREAALRVRQAARLRLGDLAQRLPCPFRWDDLVVSDALREMLRDIVFEAANRLVFWEQKSPRRLFPQGRGLLTLFSGPPGTGKTMAAQVIAASLRYDLFRIDLASVVSKYVGETSKNLQRILTRAAEMDAVLLFDEADAMFSKRATEIRDAQDKFALTDSAYLLQAIESYPGVALLATNQKSNIDPAFFRRLRFVLEFAKPDAPQRLEIWRKVVAALAGDATLGRLEPDLRGISASVDSTGAQIKYAVLNAIFISKRESSEMALSHLLRGLERELAKEGRALGSRDRERMLRHAG